MGEQLPRQVWHLRCAVALTLAACTPPEVGVDDPLDTEAGDTDTDVPDTDGDTGSTEATGRRPLCLEAQVAPPVAADLVAWEGAFAPSRNHFHGELEWRALELLGETELGTTPERIVMNRILRGWNRLRFADTEGAIADLQAAETLAVAEVPQWRGRARQILATAWMRKAEKENCTLTGGAAACLIPLAGSGIHVNQEGMNEAVRALEAVLTEDQPTSLAARWLLNIAYMALDRWPADVPAQWKLPEGVLDPEAVVPAWTNVAHDLGMHRTSLAGGSATEDFDGDGLLDLLVSSSEPNVGMQLFLNEGDGSFCEASHASGVSAIPGILNFAAADYDNDGDLDVMAPRGGWMREEGEGRPSLLRNDGEGRFVDVAVEAGFDDADVNGPTQTAVWGDIDNDGWLDVYIGREDDEASPRTRYPSSLYLNQRNGRFVDIAGSAGVASSGFVKGASFADFDADGDADLYVSTWRGKNRMFMNQGDLTFVDAAEALGVVDPIKSFATTVADVDQDGRLDLVVAAFSNNYGGGGPLDPRYYQSAEAYIRDLVDLPADPLFSETIRVYRNTGTGFEDVSERMGVDHFHSTMGFSVGDFNVDGWPDLYLATGAPEFDALEPNAAYLNQGGLAYANITTAANLAHLQKGHGTSFGDLDEDGDEDLMVQIGGAFQGDRFANGLFENPTNDGERIDRHAVTLRLEGVTANRSAIGALVRVVTPTRTFWGLGGQTGSFGGNSLQVEVGLGAETTILRVGVRWPGGDEETFEGIEVDHIVNLRQGEGVVGSRPFRRFQLAAHVNHTPDTDGLPY